MNKEILAKKVEEIGMILEKYLPERGGYTDKITDAMRYSVEAGGKRLRPMLIRECYHLFSPESEEPEILHRFMSAIEFIHTYSLVHDDLPAMDNDMYRRGKLTTHAVYGEAFGVLAGDALLNYAFETVLKGMEEIEDADLLRRSVKAAGILATKAGIYGMVGGQCLDVFSEKTENYKTDIDQIYYIHKNKTAALLECCMMIGAVIAGAGQNDIDAMEEIAGNVGLAFQIRDDILDITSTTEQLGKPVGSDEKNNKETYVTLKGLEQSQKDVEMYSDAAVRRLDSLERENGFLRELIIYLVSRDK